MYFKWATYKIQSIHKTVMVLLYPLYPCLLSGGAVLATPEAAQDMPVIIFGAPAFHKYGV